MSDRTRTPARSLGSQARTRRRLLQQGLRQGTRALYADPTFFDRLYGRRRSDVAFYVDAAQRHGGPVLELGVGTGRVAAAVAAAGIDVLGIDAMASMLRAARVHLQRSPPDVRARVELKRADMRKLQLGRRFPLVIAPFNTFTHLYTRREFEQVLAVCRQHLRRDGRLMFDVTMPDLPALMQDPERLYKVGRITDPRDGRRYAHSEASHYDVASQVRTVTMLFEPIDGVGPARAIPLTQRQFFPAELEALLAHGGFDLEARYGDFARAPVTFDSESQVIVARARSRAG